MPMALGALVARTKVKIDNDVGNLQQSVLTDGDSEGPGFPSASLRGH